MKNEKLRMSKPLQHIDLNLMRRILNSNTIRKTTAILALSFAGLAVHAQNVIESVTASTQAGIEVIKIDLSQALTTLPTGFSIQTPARVVLDLPNVGSGTIQSAIGINQGLSLIHI
jgi:type IV pilus assembly protein PilQ